MTKPHDHLNAIKGERAGGVGTGMGTIIWEEGRK